MNFFDSIVSFFEYLINIIGNIFSSLYYFFDLIQGAVFIPMQLSGITPSIINVSIMVVVGIAVIKLLIGRDNSA